MRRDIGWQRAVWLAAFLLAAGSVAAVEVRPGISGPSSIEINSDRPGADYQNWGQPNAESCERLCAEDSKCRAWAFLKPISHPTAGICYLKDKQPIRIDNPCCESGVRVDYVRPKITSISQGAGWEGQSYNLKIRLQSVVDEKARHYIERGERAFNIQTTCLFDSATPAARGDITGPCTYTQTSDGFAELTLDHTKWKPSMSTVSIFVCQDDPFGTRRCSDPVIIKKPADPALPKPVLAKEGTGFTWRGNNVAEYFHVEVLYENYLPDTSGEHRLNAPSSAPAEKSRVLRVPQTQPKNAQAQPVPGGMASASEPMVKPNLVEDRKLFWRWMASLPSKFFNPQYGDGFHKLYRWDRWGISPDVKAKNERPAPAGTRESSPVTYRVCASRSDRHGDDGRAGYESGTVCSDSISIREARPTDPARAAPGLPRRASAGDPSPAAAGTTAPQAQLQARIGESHLMHGAMPGAAAQGQQTTRSLLGQAPVTAAAGRRQVPAQAAPPTQNLAALKAPIPAQAGNPLGINPTAQSLKPPATSGPAHAPVAVARAMGAMEAGTNRYGGDYRGQDLATAQQCQATCASEAQCKAWTWVKPGVQGPSGKCWLKSSVPVASANACCTSGVK